MAHKILIIDDDQTNLLIVQKHLTSKGFEVVTAYDGSLGLLEAQSHKPDLIILDVEMPEMNGYTFLTEMRKIGSLPAMPVIVLTSHEETQEIFQMKGVKGYLIKPVDFVKLDQMISEHIRSSQENE
ncbi:MAG: response regulator [Candidatus Omnitrophica bacterium]|nr:response regulator [Candidatus Omnitrophota bacterium]